MSVLSFVWLQDGVWVGWGVFADSGQPMRSVHLVPHAHLSATDILCSPRRQMLVFWSSPVSMWLWKSNRGTQSAPTPAQGFITAFSLPCFGVVFQPFLVSLGQGTFGGSECTLGYYSVPEGDKVKGYSFRKPVPRVHKNQRDLVVPKGFRNS